MLIEGFLACEGCDILNSLIGTGLDTTLNVN